MIHQGLSPLFRFPIYQTREAYRQATGQEAPLFDPNLPHKAWLDPNPTAGDSSGLISYLGLALASDGVTPRINQEGKPYLTPFSVRAIDAGRVNIPHKRGPGSGPNEPQDDPAPFGEIQVPLRPLASDEELTVQGFGGLVRVVKKSSVPVPGEPGVPRGELEAVMQKLVLIEEKLDFLTALARK